MIDGSGRVTEFAHMLEYESLRPRVRAEAGEAAMDIENRAKFNLIDMLHETKITASSDLDTHQHGQDFLLYAPIVSQVGFHSEENLSNGLTWADRRE